MSHKLKQGNFSKSKLTIDWSTSESASVRTPVSVSSANPATASNMKNNYHKKHGVAAIRTLDGR